LLNLLKLLQKDGIIKFAFGKSMLLKLIVFTKDEDREDDGEDLYLFEAYPDKFIRGMHLKNSDDMVSVWLLDWRCFKSIF
jgi:hypothetical protein